MELSIIESIKLAAPFFSILVTAILIPLLKKGYESRKTFFSLPPQKKLAAIAYLKRHQASDSKLEKAKHKIIMREYRLFTDAILSKNIIEFYYDNEEKNARFCKAILSERHYYIFDGGVMKVSKIKHQINIIIFIITALLWFNVFLVNTDSVIYTVHLPAKPVIISASVLYSILSVVVLYKYLCIQLNKKRFCNFLRQEYR